MSGLGQFFMLVGIVVPFVLIVWYVFASIGRITHTVEDIAITMRRIEQNERRAGSS